MARSSWPARLAGPRAGVLVLLALGAAGCGTVVQNAAGSAGATSAPASSSSAATSSRRLCAQPGAVSRVIIARTGVLRDPVSIGRAGSSSPSSAPPAPSPRPSGPALLPRPVQLKVVTSAAQARALARELCALPRMPRGRVNCPAWFLGSYRLTFSADGHMLAPVTAQVSGCRLVTGLGGPPRQALNQAFWSLLARIGGWPATWPVHLPGGPGSAGPTLQPPGSGQQDCSPAVSRIPPAAPAQASASHHGCPGRYHPMIQSPQ